MSFNPTIFREYDIRGVAGVDYDESFAEELGRAYGTKLARQQISRAAVGRDCRLTSPAMASALIAGIRQTGVDVVDIGECPTPLLYFAVNFLDLTAGVQVTGSHNPPDHNGFKICIGKSSIHGEDVQELREIIESGDYLLVETGETVEPAADADGGAPVAEVTEESAAAAGAEVAAGDESAEGEESVSVSEGVEGSAIEGAAKEAAAEIDRRGTLESYPILAAYKGFMAEHFGNAGEGVKVVVDSGNGTAGPVAPDVYRAMGCEVVELYSEPDGTFPNHHPDPTVEANMVDLIAAVRENEAHLGVAFDGDSDRIGVVDEEGRIVWGDELMVIFSRDILEQHPGATVVSEVKCSQRLYDDIAAHGGVGIMWKAGHSLLKAKMRETKALLGGEMSGHLFFKDRYYGFDDGPYAGARLIEVLASRKVKLAELLSDLPVVVNTPEIRLDCPDDVKFSIASRACARFRELGYDLVDVDGVRVKFEHGWGLIRASNTQPVLVMRFEADSEERLAEYRDIVETELARIEAELKAS